MAAMVFTACQNDEGVKNPTLADEGIVNLSVGVPELATRALDGDNYSGADSAYGAIDYANYTAFLETNYDVRFQLAVYEAGAAEDAEPIYTATNYVDFASTTNFNDLRFVPGREYQFVLFADFVPQGSQEDFRYNTADLRNITTVGNSKLNAMDETYDAYFFNETIKIEAGKVNEFEAVLKRPFGKIRVLTTDYEWVKEYATPVEGTVTFYNHAIYKSFNALTGEVTTEATNDEESLTYAIDDQYYGATMYEDDEALTLFATYIFAKDAQEALNFRLDTKEADGSLIKSLDFNTEIPYQRNHLTTLVGNLLTNEADLFVRIDDNFDAEEFIGGDFENVENGLKWVREGELVGGQVYKYETNLFSFRLLSETDGTDLREGKYDYTEELPYIQNATGFDIQGIDVEKGSLEIIKRGTRAGNFYDVVFDIYATIDGKTENYILTWNGELKGAREPLAEPVVTYEVDEVDALHITFSWEAVENAADYTVEWNGEKQTVEGTSATFDFSGEDTYDTAYVTANPANADDYTATKGSVTVDWKKPIDYQPIAIELAGIDEKDGAHFYSIMEGLDLTISVPKYPKLEGAWYQVAGYLPTPFSAEAVLEETVGSAAGVVIYEPNADVDKEFDGPEAYAFTYEGAMNPYILTKAEVNWLAGYNTVKVKFSNEAGTAIEFQTSAPMEAGHETIEPSYVAVDGDQNPNIKTAEMNVLLDDKGTYTVFFKIDSLTYDVLMQYVGAIDFEKPYAPQYVLESYTAGAETIYFESENAEFEIEATSLESGDVVVKKLILDGSDDYVASNQVTAATAVVKEENGVYDARYTVTVKLPIVGAKTFDLQYVGPFVPYSAPVEPEKPIEFEATYEVKAGAYIFTGVKYNFTILVNNLATTEYISGETEDAWAYDWTLGQSMNNFRTGDFLTVENNVVTVEFTAAPMGQEFRYKMTCDMNPAVQEPEDIYLSATVDGTVYTAVEDDYMIDYTDGYANAYYQGKLMGGVTVDVADGADDIEFTFFHEERNANIHIIYNKSTVTPAGNVKVTLTLENGIYYGLYETTTYAISVEDNTVVAKYADGTNVPSGYEMSEDEQFITFTFTDAKNNVYVTALYQKVNAPVAPVFDYNFDTITLNSNAETGVSFRVKDNANNYVDFVVSTADATAKSIKAAEYTYGNDYPYDNAGKFTFTKASLESGTWYKSYNQFVGGSLKVSLNDKVYTIEMSISLANGTTETARFEGIGVLTGEEQGGNDQPGTDEPEEPQELKLTATYETLTGSIKAYHAEPYWINGDTWMEGNPLTGIKQEGKLESTETNGNVTTFKFTDKVNNKKVIVTYTDETQEPEQTVVENIKATYKSGSYGKISVNFADANNAANNFDCTFTYSGFTPNGTYTIGENATVENGTGTIVVTVNDPNYSFNIDATVNGVVYKGTVTMAL